MSGQFELFVLPTPKRAARRPGHFRAPEKMAARATGENLDLRVFVEKALGPLGRKGQKAEFRGDLAPKPHLRLFLGGPKAPAPPARPLSAARFGPEGYRLTIGPSSIHIEARSRAGLLYGLMSLTQIARNHSPIPCCRIEDWPDMAVRGIHMDLKGCTPTLEYMMGLIADLAEYKINTLLMEYENAVRLDSTPGVAKPSAWSKEEVENLAELARRHGVSLMPLVQSLGHVEYILRHEAYAHLRESQTDVQQYCPSHPGTFPFWKAQADEVMELFPQSPYFHVGADETRLLGHCPRCRKRLSRGEDELDIYLGHMNKVWRHVLDGGGTPIFWDDMVSRNYSAERIKRIPKGVAAMVWIYGITDLASPVARFHSGVYGRREMIRHERLASRAAGPRENIGRWLEEMPRDEWRRTRRFIDDPKLAPLFPSAPFIDMFAERGIEVFGASAAKCGMETVGLPNLAARVDNIRTWGRLIAQGKHSGVVSTAWSRSASLTHPYLPFDTMWYTMCASAQFYWSAEGADVDQFQKCFTRDFFGRNDGGWLAQVLEAVSVGSCPAASRELQNAAVARHAEVLEAYRIAARIHALYQAVLGMLPRHMLSYYLKDGPFAQNWGRLAEAIATQIRRVPELKAQAWKYCRGVMLPEEADELIESQFRFFEEVDLGTGRGGVNAER